MTETVTITITDTTGHPLATATVRIDTTGTHLVEIHPAPAGTGPVPAALADLDFAHLIRTAAALHAAPAAATDSTAAAGTTRRKPSPPAVSRPPSQTRETPPVPQDFGVTYWRLGSVAKVARHYDVPHHTAQTWIKALQQQGRLANPWPAKKTRPLRPRQ